MVMYFYYLLTVIGVGYFITQSTLMKPIRMKVSLINQLDIRLKLFRWFINKLDGVMNCIYCASFWIGILVYVLIYRHIDIYGVMNAFSCMGLLYVIHNINYNN